MVLYQYGFYEFGLLYWVTGLKPTIGNATKGNRKKTVYLRGEMIRCIPSIGLRTACIDGIGFAVNEDTATRKWRKKVDTRIFTSIKANRCPMEKEDKGTRAIKIGGYSKNLCSCANPH